MQVPKATVKHKKGTPQVKGEFCPFTLKIEVATLEQAAALGAISGAMSHRVAAGIASSVLYYTTTDTAVLRAVAALDCIHIELRKQGIR